MVELINTTIGTSGQVLYVNSSGDYFRMENDTTCSIQSNQILENLVGIYDNRIVKTYTLNEPTIQTLNNNYEWTVLNNYLPPDNSKNALFNFEFTFV